MIHSRSMKNKAKFYCDHCGAEVPLHSSTCPSCGQSFVSVKCPRCEFEGRPELFTEGCPVCGYLNPPLRQSRGRGENESHKGQARISRKEAGPSGLPPWVFRLISLFLILVILIFLILFLRL